MEYSEEKDKSDGFTKGVKFYKFKVLNNGQDYDFQHMSFNEFTSDIIFSADERYQKKLKRIDNSEIIKLYIAISAINKDVPVSSTKEHPRSAQTFPVPGVDEAHLFLGIKGNKLWCANTIKTYPPTGKMLNTVFKELLRMNLEFQQLPNTDIIKEIQKKGIVEHGLETDVDPDSLELPQTAINAALRRLSSRFKVKVIFASKHNKQSLDQLTEEFDETYLDSLTDGSYIKIKGSTQKITAEDVNLNKKWYFKELMTTHSIDYCAAFQCLSGLEY